MHGPTSEPEQPAPATRQCLSRQCTAIRCPANCLLSPLGSGFHVPRLHQLQQQVLVPPTVSLPGANSNSNSRAKYNIVIPPQPLHPVRLANLQLRGLRYSRTVAASYPTPPQVLYSSNLFFFFFVLFFFSFALTPHCSFTCMPAGSSVSAAVPTPILC